MSDLTTADIEPMDVTDLTLWDAVVERARRTPDKVVFVDDADRRMTFAEFRDRIEEVAAGLAAEGIGYGTKVSWQLPTNLESIVVMAALARLGAHQNPIIALQREREVFFAVRQTEAEFILLPGVWNNFDYVAMVENGDWSDRPAPKIIVLGRDNVPTGDPSTLPAPRQDPDTPRWTYYSTGTTSAPKGVLHSDASLLTAGWGYAERLGLDSQTVGAIPFSIAHIGGMDMLGTILVAATSSLVMERFIPSEAVPMFAKHGVTFTGGSVAFSELLMAEQRKSETPVMPDLKIMIGGSGPTPVVAYDEVTKVLNIIYCPAYGMTEVPMITVAEPDAPLDVHRHTDGSPIKGIEVRIADPEGNALPADVEGEIQVKGKMVTTGYVNTDLNVDAFIDGWFRTGDLGRFRPDGQLCITGRIKDIIIRKGEKISAREVEELLMKHPQVGRVAVVGIPDPTRVERICAVIERLPDTPDFTFDEMVDYLSSAGLSKYKMPEQLEFLDQLPSIGSLLKISKATLRTMYTEPAEALSR
jgi:cyclohexanecarboxylate-CoA ligase